jgi:hypothetical protein
MSAAIAVPELPVPTEDSDSRAGAKRRHYGPVVAAVIALAALALLVQFAGGAARSLGATAQPATFVALALNGAPTVAGKVAPSSKFPVAYTVINVGTTSVDQQWVVTLAAPGRAAKTVASGSVRVPGNGRAAENVTVTMPASSGTATIEVKALGSGLAPLVLHVQVASTGGQQ